MACQSVRNDRLHYIATVVNVGSLEDLVLYSMNGCQFLALFERGGPQKSLRPR